MPNEKKPCPSDPLELAEALDLLAGPGEHTENVEADLCALLARPFLRPCGYSMVLVCPIDGQFGGRLTVLLSGLHWPTVTWSPSSTRKAGETCAARFLWRFS